MKEIIIASGNKERKKWNKCEKDSFREVKARVNRKILLEWNRSEIHDIKIEQ